MSKDSAQLAAMADQATNRAVGAAIEILAVITIPADCC